jgi:hypothetical protein
LNRAPPSHETRSVAPDAASRLSWRHVSIAMKILRAASIVSQVPEIHVIQACRGFESPPPLDSEMSCTSQGSRFLCARFGRKPRRTRSAQATLSPETSPRLPIARRSHQSLRGWWPDARGRVTGQVHVKKRHGRFAREAVRIGTPLIAQSRGAPVLTGARRLLHRPPHAMQLLPVRNRTETAAAQPSRQEINALTAKEEAR